jgi:hypothetical protein
MAILNVIFAIAANYAHVAQLDWRGDPQDHLVYLTRARMLSMDGDDLFCHPDLQQVQVEGLNCFLSAFDGPDSQVTQPHLVQKLKFTDGIGHGEFQPWQYAPQYLWVYI